MASEKRPSIYDDRSTIGSSSELDEYGVWVKSEPQEFPVPAGDFSESLNPVVDMLPDFDSSGGETESLDGGDLELPDLDIPDDFAEASPGAETGALDLDSFTTGDGEDPLPALDDSIFGAEDPLPDLDDTIFGSEEAGAGEPAAEEETGEGEAAGEEETGDEGFSEISLEEFLGDLEGDGAGAEQEVLPDFQDEEVPEPGDGDFSASLTVPAGGETRPPAGADVSTQLLEKIAGELVSIRSELSTLKQEFSVIRAKAPAAEGEAAGGFFDTEADEKIALTGDELNTIINTADFTGESGAGTDVSVETVEDQVSEEELNLDLSALNLDEPALAELKEEDFSLPPDKTAEDLPVEQDETLDQLRETGAQPLSPAPENTSYLDEDPLAAEEPDISLELPAIDLDLEEAEQAVSSDGIGGEEESAPEDSLEISLDTFPGLDIPDTGEELIPEGFAVETGSLPAEDETRDEEALPGEEADSFTVPEETQEAKKPRKSAKKTRTPVQTDSLEGIPPAMTEELRTVLSYMDHLLESLPEEKIEEFAKSEHFDTYKKLFRELGIG